MRDLIRDVISRCAESAMRVNKILIENLKHTENRRIVKVFIIGPIVSSSVVLFVGPTASIYMIISFYQQFICSFNFFHRTCRAVREYISL